MDVTEVSVLHHVGIVLLLLWVFASFGVSNALLYFVSFVYLFQVNEHYTRKLRRKLCFEERKQAIQRKILSDSETVRWLNHAVEKIWPICMEQITSQKILLPIVPWFLDKYKPWTVDEAVVQHLYLGRNPPIFTEMRVARESTDDDHLILELGMNFLTADDMSAILAVKLRKRLGFGMWMKMHITCMHIEGRVLVGVKFLREWPYLGRLRVCFVEPPYFQITAKPLASHGVDVTELPGVAGWLDNILAAALQQTLVEPNMLVVDVEKFASSPEGTWFTMDEKCSVIAYAIVEVIEAADMKPADLNGLSDPYVKGQRGSCVFKTTIKRKTLSPKWLEEFKIPIHTWESPNVLFLEVLDKDHFIDDHLGRCSINISDLRGGQRHDKWLPLQNVKTGRLHVAVTVIEEDEKEGEQLKQEMDNLDCEEVQVERKDANKKKSEIPPENEGQMADEFEPINIEGQNQTGIWVHRPGSSVSQTWEPRKGENRRPEVEILREDNDSINISGSLADGSGHWDSSSESEKSSKSRPNPLSQIKRGIQKIGSIFQRSPKDEKASETESCKDEGESDPSLHNNVCANGKKEIRTQSAFDDNGSAVLSNQKLEEESDKQELGVAFVVDEKKSQVIEDGKSDNKRVERETSVTLSDGNKSVDGLNQTSDEVCIDDETSDTRSPTKRGIRGIVKNAGKSAQSLKHTFSRKATKKPVSVSEPSSVTQADDSPLSDASFTETVSPSSEYSAINEETPLRSPSTVDSSKESSGGKDLFSPVM